MTEAAIRARGLARRFGAKVAVRPFDLDVGPGGVTGLLGPNGSGKSTLLRMLVGLVPPDAGTARVAGVELRGDGTAVRRRCAYLPGETAVYGELRGRAHLAFCLRGRGRAALERARATAERLGLPLSRRVRGYSHGMKRLLLLSAALAPDVPVRILDEPTEGLDPTRRAEVLALLAADAAEGRTVLLSSHHLAEVDRACERLLFVRDGTLLADERAAEVAGRARRTVRLGFDRPPPDADALERALRRAGAAEARVDGRAATAVLPEPDPRAFLAALAGEAAVPPPASLVHGELSLRELYRDVYGVEGV